MPITFGRGPKKDRVEAARGALYDPRPGIYVGQLAVEESPEAFFEEIETNLCIQELESECGLL